MLNLFWVGGKVKLKLNIGDQTTFKDCKTALTLHLGEGRVTDGLTIPLKDTGLL